MQVVKYLELLELIKNVSEVLLEKKLNIKMFKN